MSNLRDDEIKVPDGFEGEAVMPTEMRGNVQMAMSSDGRLTPLVTVELAVGPMWLPKLSMTAEGAKDFRDMLTRLLDRIDSANGGEG